MNPLLLEQPAPGFSDFPVWPQLGPRAPASVALLLAERRAQGVDRYGIDLRAFNGRDPRADLVQELADAAFYATQLEMEGGESFVEDVLALLERVVRESP